MPAPKDASAGVAARLRRWSALSAGVVLSCCSGVVLAPPPAGATDSPTWQVVAPRILNPVGIAVDSAGDYFVDEASFQGVEEITPAGAMTVLDPSITEPGALFVTDAGTLYVADNSTGVIDEITSNDAVSEATSVPNPSMGDIDQIAVSTNGTIWFTQDNTLWEASPGGTATNSGLGFGSIAADDQGYVYDDQSTAMLKIALDGTTTSLPPVSYGSQTYINSDAAGDIYGAAASTEPNVRYSNLSFPVPEDGVWNVAPNGDVVEADTSWIDRVTRTMATSYVATQSLTEGLSLVTGPDGNVQVGGTETLAPCQVEVSPSGAETPAASSSGWTENCGSVPGTGPVAGGGGTRTDPWNQNFFYISNEGLTAFTELEGGGEGSTSTFGPSGVQFGGVASNGTNNVWTWTGQGSGTEIEEVAYPSGTVTDLAAVPYVTALGVDAAGDVFVGSNGSKLEEIPAGGGTPTVLSTSLVNPACITIDSSGNLWVTSGDQVLEDQGGVLTQVGPDLAGPTSIAFDSAGNLYALSSNGVEELVETAPPATGVVAAPGNASAAVSWSAPSSDGGSPFTSYTVTASPGGATCGWTAGPLTCTVTGLTNGQPYTFTVTATNAQGTGPPSSPSAPVTPATAPGPPTGVTAAPGDGGATASWVAPTSDGGDPITSYTATASPGGQSCAWSSGPLSCTIAGLTNGDSYTITVTATSAGGTSAASAPSGFVVPAGLPGQPTDVTATAANQSVVVTWAPPSLPEQDVGVTAYTATASPGGETCTWSTGPLTCTVSGLTDGDPYTIEVDATNFDGSGPSSAPTSPVTPATVPGVPRSVAGSADNASATVDWLAPTSDGGSPITGYTVTASPGGHTCTWSSGSLGCTVSGLANGTAYTFTVTATNAQGTGGSSEASSAVTPATVPTAPSGVGAAAGVASATLTWSAPTSDGGSLITRYTATASPGGSTCSWSTGPLTCTVSGLTDGTPYTFTVTATNAMGTGSASSPSAPVIPATVPGAPTEADVTPGDGSVTVSWSAPLSDGGDAVIGYSVTPEPGGTPCTTSTDSCRFTGLSPTTAYRFSIIAKNAEGAGTPVATSDVFPFSPRGLGIETSGSVHARGTPFVVVVGGAKPKTTVHLSLAGSPGASCSTDTVGQCAVSLATTTTGALILRAASQSASASLQAFVPLLVAPATVKHADVATIAVTGCPSGARVFLSLSDGRRYGAKAAADGVATLRLRMPTVGRIVVHAAVDGVQVAPARTITVT